MHNFLKLTKRLFGVKKCRICFAIINTKKSIGLVITSEDAETNLIDEECIKKHFKDANDIKIIKTFVVSRKCAFEFIEALRLENIFKEELCHDIQ